MPGDLGFRSGTWKPSENTCDPRPARGGIFPRTPREPLPLARAGGSPGKGFDQPL